MPVRGAIRSPAFFCLIKSFKRTQQRELESAERQCAS
jgi:hypothetical protein